PRHPIDVFSVCCDAVVISPNTRQTSRQLSPTEFHPNGAPASSQITLCFKLLRRTILGCSVVRRRSMAMPEEREAALVLIGLTPQKGRNIEQIVFLAQTRPVIWLQRRQPRLSDRLGGWCSGAGRRLRWVRAPTSDPGHPFDQTGHPPFGLRR